MKPLKFKALLKTTIWGGEEVTKLKNLTDAPRQVGESWEISGVPGNETPVCCGPEQGSTPEQLTDNHGAELVDKNTINPLGQTSPTHISLFPTLSRL